MLCHPPLLGLATPPAPQGSAQCKHCWRCSVMCLCLMMKSLTGRLTLAAGCSTSSSFRIVAPSLVMVTSPMSSTSICSVHLPLTRSILVCCDSDTQPVMYLVQPHGSQRALHNVGNSSDCGDILASHVLTRLSASLNLQSCTHCKIAARRLKIRSEAL